MENKKIYVVERKELNWEDDGEWCDFCSSKKRALEVIKTFQKSLLEGTINYCKFAIKEKKGMTLRDIYKEFKECVKDNDYRKELVFNIIEINLDQRYNKLKYKEINNGK